MMLDAEVVPGDELAERARALLAGDAAFLHAHFAGPGCFAFRIDRRPSRPGSEAAMAVPTVRACVPSVALRAHHHARPVRTAGVRERGDHVRAHHRAQPRRCDRR